LKENIIEKFQCITEISVDLCSGFGVNLRCFVASDWQEVAGRMGEDILH